MKKLTLPKAKSLHSEDAPSCDAYLVHLDRVRQVQPEIISVEKAQQMSEFFNALADPNRLRLMSALVNRELCVCDLAAAVKMGESAVSHQLRILRSQRLVKYHREGRNIYYSLADNHVMSLYQEVSEHLKEAKT
ncbi:MULTISPECIES: ArsR/SmtB family transcription factor [Nostocales]|jgi:ArsR family transcriptional regulator, lead/cadmium/zinc/bismuth-responsive transcriptional repressor|uniref:ArsR/SmtB family transcription factor n=1 Tax=Nostocales TaxID=1161 RepID=UPI00035FC271|nr:MULTISPECIES: metalloregulator ArsR/SmtB family transcription factor [Nostocales]MBD2433051.1 winged helix-turn-helix transcriptional regulator [Fischerella sp. FACHB-380]MDM9383616.1 metalloregulator ArsR/SmtB family transcription factor [Chlorogloeopsis sp. ULAP01]